MARTNTEWAVLAIISLVRSHPNSPLNVNSVVEEGVRVAGSAGHTLGQDAVQQGLTHLDMNNLISISYRDSDDRSLTDERVAFTTQGHPLWNYLSGVQPFIRRRSPRKNASRESSLSDLHAAQLQCFKERMRLTPIPTAKQVLEFVEARRFSMRAVKSHNALMQEVINILKEKQTVLHAQRQAVGGLEHATGSRKLSLEARTSSLDTRLGILDSRRKLIERRLELLMMEMVAEGALIMGV